MSAIFVMINCDAGKVIEVKKAIEKLKQADEVHAVTGRYDLVALFKDTNINKLLRTVTEKLHAIKGIKSTETLVSLPEGIDEEAPMVSMGG
ncbi:MAG: hypothetical protein CVT48_00370 [Thermoplasmata archaeon HGW-Thermoplasmata-1]|nr:MAG: hypothetical protein CVT48_00370 [Thermoplasmata archaeon HGW-Thermoplasmata-1]